jgi:Phage integrase family
LLSRGRIDFGCSRAIGHETAGVDGHRPGALDHAGEPGRAERRAARHACGYKLANDGHDTRALQAYLGHKNIPHTVRYTELTPTRFKNFWRN